ncbi:hypothetical protein [Apilactobacillus quenuiae]|uniref:hypothetical protein n=1 Tax=Apilactobacillus quenuiae TaxID=2008377 RepID=UPI0012FFED3C|nr:hypothetical protein [Apilactobacillus quenuiae]
MSQKEVKKLVGGINTIIYSISKMMNNIIGAHAYNAEYYDKKADVFLIITPAIRYS